MADGAEAPTIRDTARDLCTMILAAAEGGGWPSIMRWRMIQAEAEALYRRIAVAERRERTP